MKFQDFKNDFDRYNLESPKLKKFQTRFKNKRDISTITVMQVIDCAVGCLEGEEIYCEISSFQEATLIAALLDRAIWICRRTF